jgi:hypothetical protein
LKRGHVLEEWVLIGLALVVAGVRFFATTPGKIDRSQNKIEPVPLSITPAAQALQSTLDVADMHADSLLWKRDLLTRSDRGHIDLPRLIEGHYAPSRLAFLVWTLPPRIGFC